MPKRKDIADQIRSARKKQEATVDELVAEIQSGDTTALGQAITLLESTRVEDAAFSGELITKCLPHSGNSIRIGISGVPGVGKSSFIEVFGNHIVEQGHKLAVLAIDPSSQKSRGSILGDKTRMETLSRNKNAFIRPSPSSGTLGGVSGKTRESIVLCEAAGFDVIFVETVGVGQSETAAKSMVDFFLLLMLSGAGDDLQGIKRGIMEMADALVITKADGDNIKEAKRAAGVYRGALHLFPPEANGWTPKVLTCSAHQRTGLEEIWEMIQTFRNKIHANGWFTLNRQKQSIHWMHEHLKWQLTNEFYRSETAKTLLTSLEEQVAAQQISPQAACWKLLSEYKKP